MKKSTKHRVNPFLLVIHRHGPEATTSRRQARREKKIRASNFRHFSILFLIE
jgi:hypothetical protein